jgi:hypothetical protein
LLTEEPKVYIVLVKSIKTTSNSLNILVLLPKLAGYKDIANNNTANTLPKHYSSNYAIKIKERLTVSYRPLYNLSPKKLKVLQEYLVKAKRLR